MKCLFVLGTLLYSDRLYSLLLLQDYFREKGDQLDLFYCTDGWKNCPKNIRKISSDFDCSSYDLLIFGFVTKQSREICSILADKFTKKIIYLKVNTCIEFTQIPGRKSIYYGMPAELYHQGSKHFHIPQISKKLRFNCPFLGTLKWGKPNALTNSEFYSKYNLNLDLKICLLVPGRWDKLLNSMKNKEAQQRSVLFLEKLEEIISSLNQSGYQIIQKEHNHLNMYVNAVANNPLFQKLKKLVPKIENYDLFEALKYSSRAITLNSLIAYELYLYKLPVLDFGTSCYFFQWGAGKMKHHQINSKLIQQFDAGKKLIFGRHFAMNEWNSVDSVIQEFVQTDYQIEDFPYRSNHPIFGQTDSAQLSDFYQIISDQVSD